jgi:menaquinone-9 beta-reductase
MRAVRVVGGGPAGVMAALAAMREGAPVRIFEKSAFPRHKVCGEFLSPAILPLLRRACCGAAFLALRPAVLRSMRLHFGTRVIRHPLPESAYGLSRYELDRLLLEHAASVGAEVVREHWSAAAQEDTVILAGGRKSIGPTGYRLFGFKAHFSGPVNDDVELYFFQDYYVGVSAIENGVANVCGLAPERTLRSFGFHPSDLLQRYPPLSERLRPLTRTMDWLVTGPLVFSEWLRQPADQAVYRAGDSLGFIDPFTGSGILNAMLTGELAGVAAARGTSAVSYVRDCRRLLRRVFLVSSAFRAIIATGQAGLLASLVPGRFLFQATRPPGHLVL